MTIILKISLFLYTASFALTGLSQNNSYNPEHRYSVPDLQTDFRFIRTNLEKKHPDLYLYTPKTSLNLFFDSLYNSIKTPLTGMEFYNLITLLNSKIKDGHTMFLPSEEATNYYNQNGSFFPFYIIIKNDKLYVNMNCSSDTSIKAGAEILSINNISTEDILNQLLIRQIHDGDNQTYPVWILTNYFKEYFSFSFGHPKTFSITYKVGNTDQRSENIYALSKDSIGYYRRAKYSNRISLTTEKQGIVLEMDKQSGIATLSIKSFDSDILEEVYKQDFDSTIQNIFFQIQNAHIRNLILDVRNNQGGDFKPCELLLSYLLQRPFKYLPESKEYENIVPKKNRYKGSLFVLINGGSFSSTGILSSYLELTKRGVFIGEEAGGNKVIISGDPIDTTLPNTKIQFQFSTVKYIIREGKNTGHGVVPSYYIPPSVNSIIINKDEPKEFVLDLIQKNKR